MCARYLYGGRTATPPKRGATWSTTWPAWQARLAANAANVALNMLVWLWVSDPKRQIDAGLPSPISDALIEGLCWTAWKKK